MQVILGIGSNCNAAANISAAKACLEALLPGIQFSRIWQFPAAQGGNVPPYANLAAIANTRLSQEELKQQLRRIEDSLARDRNTPDIVTIDLDILALGNLIVPELHIPSPELLTRSFFLLPAAKLLPHFVPPDSRLSLAQAAARDL